MKGSKLKKRIAIFSLILIAVLVSLVLMTAPALAWFEGPSTIVNIQGPASPVEPGSTVTLIITETNNGDPGWWIRDTKVYLEPGGYVLYRWSPYFYGGDDVVGYENLDVGETWEWRVDVTIYSDTLFTAIGHGLAKGAEGWDVTYGVLDCNGNMAFPDEKFELMVHVTQPPPPPGDEGLTPGYWKNHLTDWALTGYGPANDFNMVFGVSNGIKPGLTLLEAVKIGGGHEKALVRHAVAALLNATHPDVDYPMTLAEVIALVRSAYATGDFEGVKDSLVGFNELGGEL